MNPRLQLGERDEVGGQKVVVSMGAPGCANAEYLVEDDAFFQVMVDDTIYEVPVERNWVEDGIAFFEGTIYIEDDE